jgi:cellulose synthase/poly-beta-1,6-N-acetylglucosamine synthase-like glycosyltransferase
MSAGEDTESLESGAFMEATAETPRAWRVAALGILAGGVGVGLLAGHKRLGGAVSLITAGVALGCAVPVALASRRPPITPEDAVDALAAAERMPTFSVVVGARDEAAVLSRLVRDLGRQDYRATDGGPSFELVVVDDRSTDGTAEIVQAVAVEAGIAAVTRVVSRRGDGLPDGKGAALTAAQPDICNGDIVLVLDADARLEPSFLRHGAGYFAAGANAVTARRRILDAGSGWLAGAQADEQTLDGELNRGRWAMGGCSEFRGNGIMIRRELLAAAGGWRASALTEDIDLSSRIAALTGDRVAWAIDVEVWEEPVRSVQRLWRQRLRWAEGAIRRALEHGPAVVTSPRLPVAARLDFVAYVGQLAIPVVVAGATVSAVISGRRRSVVSIAAGYLGVSALLGWDALRWERGRDGGPLGLSERARRTLRVSLFNGLWLVVVPRALADLAFRRGPMRYVKMEHDGVGDPTAAPAETPGMR